MKKFLALFLIPFFLFGEYQWDENHVRYELYQTDGKDSPNWLFLPGGPGAGSSYFYSLIDLLDLPGNVWLIDMPGSGENRCDEYDDDFDKWFEIFPKVIDRFDDVILVGHSFGGMFPLLFPELERKLKGFVCMNSAPSLWLEDAVSYSKQFELPDLTEEMGEFVQNPCQETFEMALDACMPYYFPPSSLAEGREFLTKVPCQYLPAVWWQKVSIERNFSAEWIPEKVPMLIICGKYDCICPHIIFKNDERFSRENIDMLFIDDAGHIPWLENPKTVRQAFKEFSFKVF